jgi:hypothetical protein
MFPRRSRAVAEKRVFEYIGQQATLSETPVEPIYYRYPSLDGR